MILMLKSSRETYSPRMTENASDDNYILNMQYSNWSYEREWVDNLDEYVENCVLPL